MIDLCPRKFNFLLSVLELRSIESTIEILVATSTVVLILFLEFLSLMSLHGHDS